MKEFLNKNWKLVGGLLFFPLIFIVVLKICIRILPGKMIGSVDGWLGFLGSYFGIIGSIGGIWWQLEKQRKEKIEEIRLKEGYTVVTFLILYRETCENMFYYYRDIHIRYFIDSTIVKPNKIEVNENPFYINYDLFNSNILEMDIYSKNLCVELLFTLEKFSHKNKTLDEFIENKFIFLEELYYFLYDKIDKILIEYEKISKEEKDYVNIVISRFDGDLRKILMYTEECFKKYKKN